MTLRISQKNTTFKYVQIGSIKVDPLIGRRSSMGSFALYDLSDDEILQLLQAARCAPSSYNTQPWHFVIIQDGPTRDEINADLIEWGAAWATKAAMLIAVAVAPSHGTTLHRLNYAIFDCGLAVQNMLLQASSMGLAAHPVGFKDRNVVEQALHLPETHRLLMFIAVGYPNSEDVVTNASRLRKPLSAIANWNVWDGPPVTE